MGEALAGWTLTSARGVSGDGRTISGRGRNPVGDVAAWIAYLGTPSTLAGDFNNDGTIDAADYVVWRKGLATGAYTQADYNTWRANLGAAAAGAAAAAHPPLLSAIPEPHSLALLLLVAASSFLARCRLARLKLTAHGELILPVEQFRVAETARGNSFRAVATHP